VQQKATDELVGGEGPSFSESPREQSLPYEVMLCALMEHREFEDEDSRRRVQNTMDQVSTLMRVVSLQMARLHSR